MREVEIKFLEVDSPALVRRLEKLGAEKVFEGNLEAVFFDFPARPLLKSKKMLRLRKKGESVELTLKEGFYSQKAKMGEETEVVVDSYANACKILRTLGLVTTNSHPTKHRVSYSLNNAHYEFDTIRGIPTYLEVEAKSVKGLERAVSAIGLDIRQGKLWQTMDVINYYKKK